MSYETVVSKLFKCDRCGAKTSFICSEFDNRPTGWTGLEIKIEYANYSAYKYKHVADVCAKCVDDFNSFWKLFPLSDDSNAAVPRGMPHKESSE